MPDTPAIWIALFTVLALVISLALWLGRGLTIHRSKDGFSVETKEYQKVRAGQQQISVASELEVERASVGDIAGIMTRDAEAAPAGDQAIDVLSHSKLRDARVGDIVGIKQGLRSSKDSQ